VGHNDPVCGDATRDHYRGALPVTPATKAWLEALVRLLKGFASETEKFLKAQE
jgi:hypothetical protein